MDYDCPSCGEHYRKKKLDETEEKWGPVCPNCKTRDCYISTPVVPSWRRYEAEMRRGDPHDQLKAADKFTQEREHATKVDPKMAKWEKSRKEWFIKQKPKWVRAGRKI